MFLGPFFFASYGLVNWITSLRTDVGSLVFGWERGIPFLAWTIVPYWSIDFLYAASLFVCRTRGELDAHAKRLLAAQLLSLAGFLLFPLRFTFDRPETRGLFGALFGVLGGFDRPFNQAPSLHVGLLVILWARYAAHVPRGFRWALHAWFVLIGVSVLTTYQHHFIDVPTGAWVGMLCLVLIPDAPSTARSTPTRRHLVLAAAYACGAALFAWLAVSSGGAGWLLLWPSGALAIVAGSYAAGDVRVFGKSDRGMGWPSRWLLAPYLVGAWINSRAWTRRTAKAHLVADGVWIGRAPSRRETHTLGSLVDVSAEMPLEPGPIPYRAVPMLDLVLPGPSRIEAAVEAIEATRAHRPTLVSCALGYTRSALAIAAWLVATDRAPSVESAVRTVREARPGAKLTARHVATLEAWADARALVSFAPTGPGEARWRRSTT